MDKRVEIHGTSRAYINGKRSVAVDFHWYEDESKWRYTVQLDSGEAFKLKPLNLRAEEAGGGAGGHTTCSTTARMNRSPLLRRSPTGHGAAVCEI